MTTLLLVPHEARRAALLDGGACGSRPPLAEPPGWRGAEDGYDSREWTPAHIGVPTRGAALVLVWQGVVAVEGCDRLARVLADFESATGSVPHMRHDTRRIGHQWLGAVGCPEGANGFALDGDWYYHPRVGNDCWRCVPELAAPPAGLKFLLDVWALATVAASRGLGEFVEVSDVR